MSHNVLFSMDFFQDEDFIKQQEHHIILPDALSSLVTSADLTSASDMFDEVVLDEETLPELYEELINEIVDAMDDNIQYYFNGGKAIYVHGLNKLIVSIEPQDVRGLDHSPIVAADLEKVIVKDLGEFNAKVRFLILEDDTEEVELG